MQNKNDNGKTENNELESSAGLSENSRNKKKGRWLLLALGLLVLVIGGLTYYYLNIYNKIDYTPVSENKTDLGITEETEKRINIFENSDQLVNILLLGVDKREEGESARSDSMMIATLDPVNNNIKLSSLMRDSRVVIDDYGYDKLAHAHAYGGPLLAIKTVNENFDMNISMYAVIDYSGLVHIIDSLGGIEIEVKDYEIMWANVSIKDISLLDDTEYTPIINPGVQILNGQQAVGYSRIRKAGNGDYERTERQRTVLTQIIKKMFTAKTSELPNIIDSFAPYIQTNIGPAYLLRLGMSVINSDMSEVVQARFPTDEFSWGETIRSTWFLSYDSEETIEELHNFIFNDKIPQSQKLPTK